MLGYFPQPYHDELTYSLCARAAEHFAFTTRAKRFTEYLFGKNAIAAIGFQSRLQRLEEALPSNYPETAESLLVKTTLLPFFLPFIDLARARRVIRAMLGAQGKAVEPLLGIMASTIHQPQFLRICPECAIEDYNASGETYWHRVHQLDSIHYCAKHHVPLVETEIPRSNRKNRHEFIAAPYRIQWNKQKDAPQKEHHIWLAQAGEWLLHTPKIGVSLSEISQTYLRLLQQKGIASANGRISHRRLHHAFLETFEPDFLQSVQCQSLNWLNVLVHPRKGRAAHPIHHLLMIRFLGLTPAEFFQQEATPPPKETVLHPKHQRCRISPSVLRSLWGNKSLSLRQISRTLGCDPTTTKRHAVKLDLPFPRQGPRLTRRPNSPKRNKIVGTALARHRKIWLNLLANSGNPKAIQSGRSTYSYLYRYDRQWLDAHKPSSQPRPHKSRVNWPERDLAFTKKVQAAISTLTAKGKPLSVASITREAGIYAIFQKHRDKLPTTAKLIVRTPHVGLRGKTGN